MGKAFSLGRRWIAKGETDVGTVSPSFEKSLCGRHSFPTPAPFGGTLSPRRGLRLRHPTLRATLSQGEGLGCDTRPLRATLSQGEGIGFPISANAKEPSP